MGKKLRILAVILIFVAVILLLRAIIPAIFKPSDNEADIIDEVTPAKYAYGIVIDSNVVLTDRVKRNESLSDILTSFDVNHTVIHELAEKSRSVFDVRKIRAGNEYALILSADSARVPHYFIYEEDPTSYIVFSLADSLDVYRGKKPVEKMIRTASGLIESSLWNAMIDNGTDPNLANELSEIYAWTIDFFGIQKGDYYQVIY